MTQVRRHDWFWSSSPQRTDAQWVCDLGDIGSLDSRDPDGFDDYAISFSGEDFGYGGTGDPFIEIRDGRTGLLIRALDPVPDGQAQWGSVMAGGLNIIGNSTPDLVVGSWCRNVVTVYNLGTLDNAVVASVQLSNPGSGTCYGFNIALLGDFHGLVDFGSKDGYSELVLTDIGYDNGLQDGRAYVVDVNDPSWVVPIDPPPGKNTLYFGYSVAVPGDCWPAGGDGFPEIVIGDPYYAQDAFGGYDQRGLYATYHWDIVSSTFKVLSDPAGTGLPQQVFEGASQQDGVGRYLSPAGDADDHPEGVVSWDFHAAAQENFVSGFTNLEVRARDLTQPASQNFVTWGQVPAWSLAEYWYLLVEWSRRPQVVNAGDIDLDGFDDHLVVRAHDDCTWPSHRQVPAVFEIFSGDPATPGLSLWKVARLKLPAPTPPPSSPPQLKTLWGTASDPGSIQRQFAADLGDVNGDGLDDVAIITGINRSEPTNVCGNPNRDPTTDTTCLVIYSPNPFMTQNPPPSLPPGEPGIRGNRAAQIVRPPFVQIHNLLPGDVVELYEATSLQTAIDPWGCGTAELIVYTNPTVPDHGPITADSNGEAAFFLPPYVAADIGTTHYFQAYVHSNGATPCRYSVYWSLEVVDLSEPRWTLPK